MTLLPYPDPSVDAIARACYFGFGPDRAAFNRRKLFMRAGDPSLPPEVARLCQDLVQIFEHKAPSAAPVCQPTNPWGAFTFRAYRLDRGEGPGAAQLIGVIIERLEPLALKVWRHAEELPLAGREVEVRRLPVAGRTRAELAERLGVSENTAVSQFRNLYGKLGVHGRVELIESLHARL